MFNLLTFNEPCSEERMQEKCEFPEFLLSKKSRLHHLPPGQLWCAKTHYNSDARHVTSHRLLRLLFRPRLLTIWQPVREDRTLLSPATHY